MPGWLPRRLGRLTRPAQDLAGRPRPSIREAGHLFRDRLAAEVIEDALEWLDQGEEALAIGVLCDQLMEHSVPLTEEEWAILAALSEEHRSTGGTPIASLRTLIPPQNE